MLFSVDGKTPAVHSSAFVAPTAVLIGEVTIAAGASVWFNAVLRGDAGAITVGEDSNIQDCAVLHEEIAVGRGCTLAHLSLVHDSRLEDDVLIGNGAQVYGGVLVRTGAVVGAGAVVPGPMELPAHTLWLGVPAKQMAAKDAESERQASEKLRALTDFTREHYMERRLHYLNSLTPADAAAEALLRSLG